MQTMDRVLRIVAVDRKVLVEVFQKRTQGNGFDNFSEGISLLRKCYDLQTIFSTEQKCHDKKANIFSRSHRRDR